MIKHCWKDDSYWSRASCDCCDDDFMECYNLVDDEGNYMTHSVSYPPECYVESYMLHKYGPYHERSEEEDLLEAGLMLKTEEEMRELCESVGLEVIVEIPNDN